MKLAGLTVIVHCFNENETALKKLMNVNPQQFINFDCSFILISQFKNE